MTTRPELKKLTAGCERKLETTRLNGARRQMRAEASAALARLAGVPDRLEDYRDETLIPCGDCGQAYRLDAYLGCAPALRCPGCDSTRNPYNALRNSVP